jgi:hypothetical protein
VSPTCYTIRFATLTPPYNTTRERIFFLSLAFSAIQIPTLTQNIYVDPFPEAVRRAGETFNRYSAKRAKKGQQSIFWNKR